MSNLDVYKAMISDDEVIKALIKESKAREGELERTRVRPNMNFFQRTVSNIVSSNHRITSKQEQKIAKEKEKNYRYKPRKVISKKRSARELINEILTSQTKFIKSSTAEDSHFNQKLGEPDNTSKKTETKNSSDVGNTLVVTSNPITISSDENESNSED